MDSFELNKIAAGILIALLTAMVGSIIADILMPTQILQEKAYAFNYAYTSRLTRAIKTLNIILDEMQLHWVPVSKEWRLNERHYGDLQGLNKAETAEKHGEAQVKIWRRSYD